MNRRQRIKRFKQEILKYGYPDKKNEAILFRMWKQTEF